MLHSQSKSKLVSEAIANSKREMGIGATNILRRAAQEQYKMEPHFKNLENPLQYLRNNQIQSMINDTTNVSSKLQNQMSQTTQFSKNIYKEVISNEDYVKFFKNQTENQQLIKSRIDLQEILRMQRKLKEKQRKVNDLATLDTFFKKSNNKTQKSQNSFINYKKGSRQKQVLNQGQANQIRYDHIKKLGTPQFDKQCKHIQFYDILKKSLVPQYNSTLHEFNIDKNEQITNQMQKWKFTLINDDCEFSDRSKELSFDFENNLTFWSEKSEKMEVKFLNNGENLLGGKLIQPEAVLRPFLNFRSKAININDVFDFGLKKITPELIVAYFKLKSQHYEIIEKQKRDEGLDEKYYELLRQYNHAQQSRLKNQTRKLPTKYTENKAQTINQYEDQKTHKFFESFEPVEDVFLKLKKLNVLRQRAMKSYKQKPNMVIIKNICLQIDGLLFKLLILMLKGENLFLKSQNSSPNGTVPLFTCSDLINVKDKQQVQRKILQLIYGNYDKFEVQKVDDIPKKTIIETYVEERAKNNKIYDMLDCM